MQHRPQTTQSEVLQLCGVQQLLDAALAGYNVTIFAYGGWWVFVCCIQSDGHFEHFNKPICCIQSDGCPCAAFSEMDTLSITSPYAAYIQMSVHMLHTVGWTL